MPPCSILWKSDLITQKTQEAQEAQERFIQRTSLASLASLAFINIVWGINPPQPNMCI